MRSLWLWNHLKTGMKHHQGFQWALWRKQNRDLSPQWDVQGIPAYRALSDIAKSKQKEEPVNYAAFDKEKNGTCEVLIIFVSNLEKQNNAPLGAERKGDCMNGAENLP